MVAWPCTKWSVLQTFGFKSQECLERLSRSREEQRRLLAWVQKIVLERRALGCATGETPFASKAWKEPVVKDVERMVAAGARGEVDFGHGVWATSSRARADEAIRLVPIGAEGRTGIWVLRARSSSSSSFTVALIEKAPEQNVATCCRQVTQRNRAHPSLRPWCSSRRAW